MSFTEIEEEEPSRNFATAPAAMFDFKTYFAVLKKYFWIILLTEAIAIGGALAFLRSSDPTYRSTAEMKVESRYPRQGLSLSSEGISVAADDLKTLEVSFLNFTLMQRVIQNLDLKNRNNFISPNRPAKSVSEGELTGYLMGQSKVAFIQGTRLIEVSFENWNPMNAQEVANALVKEGINYDRDQRINALDANIKYLQEEAKKLEENLKRSEEKQNDYVRSIGNISISEENNLVGTQLQQVNLDAITAKNQRLKLEGDYDQIKQVRDAPDKLVTIQSVRNIPAIMDLTTRVNDRRGNLAKLQQRYREKNPFIIQATTELTEFERLLREEILNAPAGFEYALDMARRNEANLDIEKAELEETVMKVKDLSVQSQVYQRQIDADRLTYETALKRLNEELSQARSQPVLLQIVSPAGPAYLSSTRPKKILTAGAFGGFVVGVGILFLIAQLAGGIKSAEDAERLLNFSVLAAIPQYFPSKYPLHGKQAEEAPSGLLAECPLLNDMQSSVSEAFRTLRTFLYVTEDIGKGSHVLFTSSTSGEGTSFCCLNLAVSLAQSGQRTLLVDADLRKPVQEQRLLDSIGHFGLSDYLQNGAAFYSVIRSSSVPNLDLIPAGSLSGHIGSTEMLSRPQFQKFMEEAEVLYDRIIFDSAPIKTASDALAIARYFPQVCLVVRLNKTSQSVADRSLQLLTRSGGKVAGLVANYAQVKAEDSYFEADSLLPIEETEPGRSFPAKCGSCDRRYESMEDYLQKTLPVEGVSGRSANTNSFIRKCRCGTSVILPAISRRDYTSNGVERREMFGSLLNKLEQGGMPLGAARMKLLLVLKTWRNEISDLSRNDSPAARRRQQLFEEVLSGLVNAGMEKEQARDLLIKAVNVWRMAT